MKLSNRLERIASFVPKNSIVADIGTDHGYIPIFLVENKISPKVFACDVRKGPLERAACHIKSYGFEKQIETRLSDGLASMKNGEADTVVIAGMGGELVIHILEGGRHVWDSTKTWILSPQSDLYKVRQYLFENGFEIVNEEMLFDEGKYYNILVVRKGSMQMERELYYFYGKHLIQKSDPVFKEYLKKEKLLLESIRQNLEKQIVSENDKESKSSLRIQEINQKLAYIEEAEHEMQ